MFLELEKDDAKTQSPDPILRLTDDQGVFTVVDAPAGRYRLSVYKDARQIVATGLELGAPGTTIVPVRLPPAT